MTAEEKLEKVRQYVNDEMQLSWEQVKYWVYAEGNAEQARIWKRRYDVLYGVLLTIED